jgi:hypothetical protein
MKDNGPNTSPKKPTKLRNHIYKTESFDSLHIKSMEVSNLIFKYLL